MPQTSLRAQRLFLAAGAALYLGWWALVEALLPGSFNPLPSRVGVVLLLVAALGATYVLRVAARRASEILAASMCAVTLHYGYLLHGNHGDPTWWAGGVLVVACVGALPISQRGMLAYSAFTLVGTVGLMAVDRRIRGSIFLPSIATILLLSNVALRSRVRADQERRTADALRLDRDRAEEASKLKSMFLGLVSHELVTPLQSIRLNAERLTQMSDSAKGERADVAARIERGTRRLTDLIESLLEYARVEAGRLELQIEDLDLCAIAHDVVDDLASQARSKGIELRLRLGSEHHALRSDPRLVRLILTNLASNAVRYTDHGSVEVAVAVDVSDHRVLVADTGRGIPPDARETIFEAFTQLEPLQRKHLPGIGLGLALVKQLSAALGARVEVSSAVGVGTTFTVTFP